MENLKNLIKPTPKKFLSQNYLIDENIARNIVNSFKIKKSDYIIEIGAGKGALTKYILFYTDHLIPIEIDKINISFLNQLLPDLNILNKDFLKLNFNELYAKHKSKFRIIGNIPYKITSPIIFKLIDNRNFIIDAQLMIQEEVAQRIIAKPNSKIYGIPSILINTFAKSELKFKVSKNCFYPKPKVESRIIYFDFSASMLNKIKNINMYVKLIKTAFNMRRKKLKNALKPFNVEHSITNIDLNRRAENLSIEEFISLANQLC